MSQPTRDLALVGSRDVRPIHEFGPFRLEPMERLLVRDGRPVALTPKAFDLLVYLVERRGRLVEKHAIMAALWPDAAVEETNLTYNVSALRKALGDRHGGEQFIQTVPTRGYRFVAPVRELAAAPAAPSTAGRMRAVAVVAVALAAAGLVGGIGMWLVRRLNRVQQRVVRFELPMTVPLADLSAPMISPDGSQIALVARGAEESQVHLRPLASLDATPLSGTGGARQLFFSPDGRALGFYAGGFLKKVDLATGHVTRLCPATQLGRGGTWGEDGRIYFAPSFHTGLSVVSAAGGQAQTLTELGPREIAHGWPDLLPGGRHLLFSRLDSEGLDEAKIEILTLATGERRTVLEGGFGGRYLSTGHLVYMRQASLLAVPFDVHTRRVQGTPLRVLEGVGVWPNGAAFWSVSRDGTLVYCPGLLFGSRSELAWIDRVRKQEQAIPAPPAVHIDPKISPDGRRLAIASNPDLQMDVWVNDFDRGTWTRLTTHLGADSAPVWHPRDPDRVVFSRDRHPVPQAEANLFSVAADGSGSAELLYRSPYRKFASSSAPASRLLAFTELHPETKADIWLLSFDGTPVARPFLRTSFSEAFPALSPDGRWLAHDSDESGRFEVYVRPVAAAQRKWQLSAEGGDRPRWSADGRQVVFRSGRRMMAVDVAVSPSFAAGTPRVLFEGEFDLGGHSTPNYDLALDGRLLMIKSTRTPAAPSRLVVVVNWFAELRQKVGR